MSIETQKTIIKQFFHGALKEGKLEILEKILEPECSYMDGGKLKYTTREDFIDYVREARKPYIRTDVVIDDIIAEGEKVAVRCTYHLETNTAQVTVSVMGFFQFHGSKIVKIWRTLVISSEQEKKSR